MAICLDENGPGLDRMVHIARLTNASLADIVNCMNALSGSECEILYLLLYELFCEVNPNER